MLHIRVSSFLEFPPEILCQIVSFLSKHDLSVCVRVSKAWYDDFMDSLWHTVALQDVGRLGTDRPLFDRISCLYGPHLSNGSEEAESTVPPFLRNIHRIRVMKVQYTSFLNLFWDQSPLPLEPIPLKELCVDFEDYPHPPPPPQNGFGSDRLLLPAPEQPNPTNMEAIIQILRRSNRLSTFSFIAGALVGKTLFQNQACLLASLPPTIEKLYIPSGWLYHSSKMIVQEQRTRAVDLFVEQKKGDVFENLTTLSIKSVSVDPILLVALVERSPKLEELSLDGHQMSWSDAILADIVSKVSSKGWKTLGLKSFSHRIGPLTVAAILRNNTTLENLRLQGCRAFDSKSIQKLLCSAPNLKRFDCIVSSSHFDLEPYSLMALDVIESAEDWVCLGLETFKCYIGGVPRPDVDAKKNGRPLTEIYNNGFRYSMTESNTIQRRVLAQLGRLTKLREITLGKDVVDYDSGVYQGYWGNVDPRSCGLDEMGFQYQCLTMSLQGGLDELRDLKCLRRLTLEKMNLGVGKAEQTWMKENWPEYGKECRDTFWTSRGHRVCFAEQRYERSRTDHDWW